MSGTIEPTAVGHGARVRRVEDPQLVCGARAYTDDLQMRGARHAVFVRAGLAHARVLSVEVEEALAAPGVVAVYTAADFDLAPFPAAAPPDGTPEAMRRPVLASDTVRFIGEPVAIVVADTRAHAVDASELVFVDYEPLDVLVDPARALDPEAPRLFADGNLASRGPRSEVTLDDAEVVVRRQFVNQRVAAVPLEPGAAIAAPDPDTPGSFVLWTPSQGVHNHQATISGCLRMSPERLRVVTPATGGGFGARIAAYPEMVAIVAAARALGEPVRYVEGRTETMLAMQHGRATLQDVELRGTRDGRITGLRVRVTADCGAYPADATEMPGLTHLMACGVYDIAQVDFEYACVVTNTTPIGAYRGAGRPEATALLERSVDLFAREVGMDPAEVRRRNFVAEFPHETVTGANYDSGAYAATLDRLLAAAGYEDLRTEQAARRERADVRQLGIGLCSYVEWTGFGSELATCEVERDGTVTVRSGTAAHGQGHETAYAQLVAGALGVPIGDVRVIQSDTAKVSRGMGTMGSRSLQIGGSAIHNAAQDVLEQGRELAGRLLEADPGDIAVFPGRGLGVAGAPGTAVPWAQLAAAAGDEGLWATNDFETPDATYPFGAHLALVEVDVETGAATLLRHVTVDDAGTIANPLIAEGQIHGGIAQGVAQALFEEILYDEDGNNVTGSLASYAIPGPSELPMFETERTQTPTPRNPLGAKGIGESGTIGSTPAVWNAVVDAVSHLDVDHIEMPATPQRVWQAISAARAFHAR